MNRPIFLSLLIFTAVLFSCSKDRLEDIQITSEETFSSQIVNDDYKLYFFLPPNYSEEKSYPVIYLLDGDWHTNRVAKEINQLWKENSIPECILIGIGNSDNRARDYTYPTDNDFDANSGHADKFYEFIKKELIPHVEDNYSTDTTSRHILGHSAGGFFVLYAMLNDENPAHSVFKGYIAASPSIHWVNGYLFDMEQELSERTNDFCCSLFISTGSDEGVAVNVLAIEMYERLLNRNYIGFEIDYRNLKDKAHEGASIPGFVEGIKYTLNN